VELRAYASRACCLLLTPYGGESVARAACTLPEIIGWQRHQPYQAALCVELIRGLYGGLEERWAVDGDSEPSLECTSNRSITVRCSGRPIIPLASL